MSKRKAEQPHPDGEPPRPAGLRRSARLIASSSPCGSTVRVSDEVHTLPAAAAALAAEEQQRPAAASAPAGSPFRRLATIELQLITQHCDLNTLLALARCSRFTLSAASHPFAWRALSPLSFPTTVADLGANLRGSRLLAHCDVALRWVHPTPEWYQLTVSDAELAAIDSVPRLVELDACARKVQGAEFRRLLSRPALAGLTALHTAMRQMDDSCIALLPLHQPRLRTLSLQISRDSVADQHLLAPLALLPALTDLSLDGAGMDESAVEIINRCASLRRLHLSRVQPAVVSAVLAAPARARLESLSLRDVRARPSTPVGVAAAADRAAAAASRSATDVHSWKASFENLQSLRSLSLQRCKDLDVMFAGAAAALATGRALRSLTALRADSLKMDNEDGSLIPLLAAHCPQLRRLHIFEIDGGLGYNPGALAGLPLLSNLCDLRLQTVGWPPNGDELAVGRCASLTRLHLSDVRRNSLHAILCSPQLQRLETLSLGSVQIDRDRVAAAQKDLDWSVCFANLRSLRALSLDGCDGGDQLLSGVQAACRRCCAPCASATRAATWAQKWCPRCTGCRRCWLSCRFSVWSCSKKRPRAFRAATRLSTRPGRWTSCTGPGKS